MKRRSFICGAVSTLAAGGFAGKSFAASTAKTAALSVGAIDTHTHFYDPTRPQGVPWPPKNNKLLYKPVYPSDFRRVTRGLGVTGTVVVEASAWLEDNQWLLDLAAKDPVIVGIVGRLEAGTPQFKDHLARFTKHRLFCGIRINSRAVAKGLDRPEFIADLKRVAEANRQIDVVGGPAMLAAVGRLAAKIPDLRIVIDHLPFDFPKTGGDEMRAALRTLGKRRLVYAKVSNVPRHIDGRIPDDVAFYRPALDELWEIFGPERLIYGSNWPVSKRIAPYPVAHKIVTEYFGAKGEDALAKYFRENSLAAYRWIERPKVAKSTAPK